MRSARGEGSVSRMAEAAHVLYEPNHPTIEAAYENAPPDVVCEILHGALAMAPRPAPPHGRFAKKLGSRLFDPFDEGIGGPGGWIFIDEPELHLGAEIVVPEKGAEGVIIAQGANIGGWSLYAKDGKLKYCYNWSGLQHFYVEASTPIPANTAAIPMIRSEIVNNLAPTVSTSCWAIRRRRAVIAG